MSQKPHEFSLPKMEENILKFWEEQDIFNQSISQSADSKPYIFYDGPPFATGLPHHGHLLASTIKDIIPRYQTMNGRYVIRRFGWDCHGLPIEHEINKALKMSAHEAVQQLGIDGYNRECRNIVMRYSEQWRQTITRLGRWVDFDFDYKTMDAPFMESVWWVFQQLWEKDMIYHGVKIMPFSTALNTPLANFEASSNYQDVQDPSITVSLTLKDENADLLIWTTTPWTLPSNLAVCVHPQLEYATVWDEQLNRRLIMAKSRVEQIMGKRPHRIEGTRTGDALIGKKYHPLFPYFKQLDQQGAFQIISADFVSDQDGTGLVHAAPGFGEDDHQACQKAGIKAVVCPIDTSGCFTEEVTDFKGQYVKSADSEIMKRLKEEKKLFHQSTLVHAYPMCPRSDTPLLYRACPSWFVRVDSIKEKMKQHNQTIHWVPDHIKNGRFGKWLDGAKDWAISRNRVWGTPIPIWTNDQTGRSICIGSIAQLEELTGEKVHDLHRENIDHLTFSKAGEPGVYKRIPEVLDCWFESGSMPYAQLHYPFDNEHLFEQGFPAEFIAEGVDQTRGWFYTLMFLSTALFDKPAFKNVIVSGIVLAKDGKKMSKRLKNYTAPDELMDHYGADALRLYLIHSGLVKAEEQRFDDEGVRDMTRRTLLPWMNAYKFFHTYATVDKWKETHLETKQSKNILDQWIISRLQSLKSRIEEQMNVYQLAHVVPELLHFLDELTNVYIRLNRHRFWTESMNEDKNIAFHTLYTVLTEFTQCMAPFTPFLSEYIYQQLTPFNQVVSAPISVHLCSYPKSQAQWVNAPLEDAVARLQQILILGRQQRHDLKIKTKIPLESMTIIHRKPTTLKEIEKLESFIKESLNIKTINYETDEEPYIKLYAKPNSPILGKRFGKEFKSIRLAIESLPQHDLIAAESGEKLNIMGHTIAPTELLIYREPLPNTHAVSNRLITIAINPNVTDDLLHEGLAREMVNRIQKARKEANLNVDDRIQLILDVPNDLQSCIEPYSTYIMQETLSTKITFEDLDKCTSIYPATIDDHSIKIHLSTQLEEEENH